MSFRDIELKPEYRSRLDNVIRDFYNPVLKQAVTYKRAVGFFSSSALLSLTAGICGLVENGGSIQMIASPRLLPEDIEAINDGIRRRDEVIKEALLRELREPKGKFEEARLNLLSNLIAAGRLDIKIAFLEDDNTVGMFHEKLGLMYDSNGNIIAFSGSMNESANAFTSNYEAIDVFASWTQDADRVYNKQSAFNAMWEDYEPSIKVMDFPDVKEEILHRYRVNDRIDTHLDNESSAEDILPAEESNTPIGASLSIFIDFYSPSLLIVSLFYHQSRACASQKDIFMSSFCPLFSSGNCEKQNFGYNVPHHAVTAVCSCRLSAISSIFPDIPGIALIIRTPTAATNRTNDSFLLNFLFLLFLFIIVPLSCYILSVTISAFVIFLYIFLYLYEISRQHFNIWIMPIFS